MFGCEACIPNNKCKRKEAENSENLWERNIDDDDYVYQFLKLRQIKGEIGSIKNC